MATDPDEQERLRQEYVRAERAYSAAVKGQSAGEDEQDQLREAMETADAAYKASLKDA
jgi:hypothetical protein